MAKLSKYLKIVEKLSFEEALQELEKIVDTLESGKVSFKDSVELYEKGIILKKHCAYMLDSAKLQIQQITKDVDDIYREKEVNMN